MKWTAVRVSAPKNVFFMKVRLIFLKSIVFILISACDGSVPPSFGALLLESDFETGDYESYGWNTSGPSPHPQISTSSVCAGNYALQIANDYPDYRSELSLGSPGPSEFDNAGEYWLGFGIFLPSDWGVDARHDIIMQFHGRPDLPDEGYRNPPLAIIIKNDVFRLYTRWDSKKITSPPDKPSVYEGDREITLKAWETAKWTNFVLHIKFSYTGSGLVDIWIDGVNVLTYTEGNAYNDDRGLYLKIGNYKSDWKHNRTDVDSRLHYFDELRIGDKNANYKDVVSGCGNPGNSAPLTPAGLTLRVGP